MGAHGRKIGWIGGECRGEVSGFLCLRGRSLVIGDCVMGEGCLTACKLVFEIMTLKNERTFTESYWR